MPFPSGKTAIVGVYTTAQAKSLLPRPPVSLQLEAVKGALDDAGLSFSDVDGVIPLDPAPYGTPASVHMFWAEQFGARAPTYPEGRVAAGGRGQAGGRGGRR